MAYYWALTADSVKPIEYQKWPLKVQVWAAVSSQGLIGPYFFHSKGSHVNVNQWTYQTCLLWFIKQLKQKKIFRRAILMQDGATPHTALSTRKMIKSHFGDRVIGRHFDHSWPPYSPDLTPADYYLWPTLKRELYDKSRHTYTSIPALKRAITYQFKMLRNHDLSDIFSRIKDRWQRCIDGGGSRV